ncbi:MAG: hypothetical protein PVI33_06745 [Candidatus Omnitrophota bacterium]
MAINYRLILINLPRYLRTIRVNIYSSKFSLKFMRRYRQQICAFLLLLIIGLLQSTTLNYFPILDVKPDAILAALIMLAPFFSLGWSVAFAFLGGLFRDIFSSLPFGFNICLSMLWVILAKQIFRRLSAENGLIRNVTLCLFIVLNNLTMQSILFMFARPLSLGIFLRIVTIESIFTLALAFLIYRLFVHLFMS